jgi:hypothetical protein
VKGVLGRVASPFVMERRVFPAGRANAAAEISRRSAGAGVGGRTEAADGPGSVDTAEPHVPSTFLPACGGEVDSAGQTLTGVKEEREGKVLRTFRSRSGSRQAGGERLGHRVRPELIGHWPRRRGPNSRDTARSPRCAPANCPRGDGVPEVRSNRSGGNKRPSWRRARRSGNPA